MATVQAAFPALGTALLVLMGSPLVYEQIPNLGDWSPLSTTATEVDVSSHNTTDAFDEWVVTQLSGGKISAPLYYIPGTTVHEQLFTYYKQRSSSSSQPGVPVQFRVDFPDAAETTYKFKGFVTSFKSDAPVKGVLKTSLEIRVTGVPDYAATRDNSPLT